MNEKFMKFLILLLLKSVVKNLSRCKFVLNRNEGIMITLIYNIIFVSSIPK